MVAKGHRYFNGGFFVSEDRYNGWANRETWAVALYGDNEEWIYRHLHEEAKEVNDSQCSHPRYEMKTRAKNFFENLAADVVEQTTTKETAEMILDIGSLWRVDWYAIADHYLTAQEDT